MNRHDEDFGNKLIVLVWETQPRQGKVYDFNISVPEGSENNIKVGDYIVKRSGAVWEIKGITNIKRSSRKGFMYLYCKASIISYSNK